MESRYRREDAQRMLDLYAKAYGQDVALRVYTSRLLGQEPGLVLHGGGNTSVKTQVKELVGDTTDVLYVKGSGWDLAAIEPRGFPACRLAHLKRLCELPALGDEQMVAELRGQMLDPTSPTPSVEALLHAYLPAKFIDHTHADAVLAVVDQKDSERLAREVLGERILFVPYVMPGFVLAKAVADLWRKRPAGPEPTAMVLDKHGIFTWGDSALESYERMIAMVTRAERWIEDARPPSSRRTVSMMAPTVYAGLGPVVRGAMARASGRRWIATWHATTELVSWSEREDLERVSSKGCITPDHVIRTKGRPLVVRLAEANKPSTARPFVEEALVAYAARYREYFERGKADRNTSPTMVDPWPRVVLFPGLGALALGKTRADAEIVADIHEHTAEVISIAEALGGFEPASELDLFDLEYWSLEQAKLKKGGTEGELGGRIALVTGAASGIGLATAKALLAAGAHVVALDKDEEALAKAAEGLRDKAPGRIIEQRCDVLSDSDVTGAIERACIELGGIDIVVSNAGGVFTGPLHTPAGDRALQDSLALNLQAHQRLARAAADVMIAQGTGGAILFNASKSAFNQGPDFGPYAVAKAALVALMRQYAVDLGASRIRANAVNADRIRTGLFDGGVLEARAKARGVDIDDYFTANLLRRETTADDVARAFLYLATAEATSGCVLTVDGGNAAAFPR